MDMEKCNLVSTPGLQVAEKDFATEEQLPSALTGLYRWVTGRLLNVAGQRSNAQQDMRERTCTRHELSNKRSLATSETRHAVNKRLSIWKFER